jgi:hypothetical protein
MGGEKDIQAEGGVFLGNATAGRDLAGRDIHHSYTVGAEAAQIQAS